jgi:purine nucleosidase/pyrimidine-specific ribonucleoside hydrolase
MPKRVIIDTDPGVDDAMALILAFRSPELQIEAITTTCGNIDVAQATRNVFTTLLMLNPQPRPLIARGALSPLHKPLVTAEYVHGSDGLGELDRLQNPDGSPRYPGPGMPDALLDATELYLNLLERYPDELTLIMLGPLTNLARAILADKGRVMRLREVIVMGGAIAVSGNVTPAAEFNIYVDPHAAEIVFSSGLPIKLVPLDVTQRTCLNRATIEELAEAIPNPLGSFLSDLTRNMLDFMEKRTGLSVLHLHDPLAVGVAIDPSLVSLTPLSVGVETDGKLTGGMTLADLRPIGDDMKPPPNIEVALEVDADRFLSLFEERLCQKSW